MLEVEQGTVFEFRGEKFFIDMSPTHRRKSDELAFTLVKSQNYISVYEELANTFRPASILELGIFQGGSYVLLDKLFEPLRMSAVDISPEPVAPLIRYLHRTPGRFAHFGVSQSDEPRLREIIKLDLMGTLDLVVDDASHTYEHSKRSFEVLFPLLSPNGLYVVEDWAWAHHRSYQAPDAPFAKLNALTSLLYEQIALMGSKSDISEIRILKNLYVIRKSAVAGVAPDNVWEGLMTRGRKILPI